MRLAAGPRRHVEGSCHHAVHGPTTRYYEDKLSGERLRRCYELAPARIRRYLQAETTFAVQAVRGSSRILELGCGYGRALGDIAPAVSVAVGCDTSWASLRLGRMLLARQRNVALVRTDAARLSFAPGTFDAVICIQNGISAFGVDRRKLVSEAARVTRPGGHVLFSSYSPRIWEERLDWFRRQADAGLVGAIDEAQTRDGTIVCRDGFRATTVDEKAFTNLFRGLGLCPELREVDESSLFCLARI